MNLETTGRNRLTVPRGASHWVTDLPVGSPFMSSRIGQVWLAINIHSLTNHERGIEADAELTNNTAVHVGRFRRLQFIHEYLKTYDFEVEQNVSKVFRNFIKIHFRLLYNHLILHVRYIWKLKSMGRIPVSMLGERKNLQTFSRPINKIMDYQTIYRALQNMSIFRDPHEPW